VYLFLTTLLLCDDSDGERERAYLCITIIHNNNNIMGMY